MTAHEVPSTCHCGGRREVLKMTIARRVTKQNKNATQKRLRILGTSMKKLDLSTSFFVAPQVML